MSTVYTVQWLAVCVMMRDRFVLRYTAAVCDDLGWIMFDDDAPELLLLCEDGDR